MWSTSLRDVTCCSYILGIPPHAKELILQDSAYTLGMSCQHPTERQAKLQCRSYPGRKRAGRMA